MIALHQIRDSLMLLQDFAIISPFVLVSHRTSSCWTLSERLPETLSPGEHSKMSFNNSVCIEIHLGCASNGHMNYQSAYLEGRPDSGSLDVPASDYQDETCHIHCHRQQIYTAIGCLDLEGGFWEISYPRHGSPLDGICRIAL